MIKKLKNIFKDSITSVLPIILIVVMLSFFIDFTRSTLLSFSISMVLIIVGISLFTFGSEVSMELIGEKVGNILVKKSRLFISCILIFIIGIVITVAEPDLKVLAEQMTSIPNIILILSVGIGVGMFLVFAVLKTKYNINLTKVLIFAYIIIFLILFITPNEFIPLAFDSGGVTTGPISVPFIVALGVGLASVNVSKKEKESSFGLVGLCSVGPILVVLLLGIIFNLNTSYVPSVVKQYESLFEVINVYSTGILSYFIEVLEAIIPILVVYLYFLFKYKITNKKDTRKVFLGMIITIIGLSMFLLGANMGLMPVGSFIGNSISKTAYKWMLIPLGFVIGFVTVKAEPAVKVLTSQIEEITEGAIKKNMISMFLSIGVSASVGLAMLRSLTGISILYIIVPGYLVTLLLTLFTPSLFTSIAFDSGGAASGPMTATFLLPISIGASVGVCGNPLTDAFGLVALVAMTPLIMIQILGLVYKVKEKYKDKHRYHTEIVEYDWSDTYAN